MVVSVSDFDSFLKIILSGKLLSIQEVIVPSKSLYRNDDNLFFTRLGLENAPVQLGDFRTVDPVKILFYMPREKILPAEYKVKKRLIVGVRACDLNALAILDTALTKSGFVDPSYQNWRNNSIIISSDCSSFLPNCFCTLLGNNPFPEQLFDLNLSRTDDQYLITTGSPMGEELLNFMKMYVPVCPASQETIEKVRRQRAELIEKQALQIQTLIHSAESNFGGSNDDIFAESSKHCVGCGSCTNICPTCYCLILNDESNHNEFIKFRTYDSCQLHGYARVAGGGTPRPKIEQRFRNRIMCKFSYMKRNFNVLGCTGCGRCMEVCNLGAVYLKLADMFRNRNSEVVSNDLIISQ